MAGGRKAFPGILLQSKGFFRLLRRRSPVFFYRPMLRTSYTTLQMPSDRLRVVGGWGMAGLS